MEKIIIFAGESYTKQENESWESWLSKILQRTAGTREYRGRISSVYMKAMAEFQDEGTIPSEMVDVLLEIALQRISCGAVVHKNDPTPTFEALPFAFRAYASQNGCLGSEPGLMGEECYQFIINKLEVCCKRKATIKHALAICFGLGENLTPDGDERNGYMLNTVAFNPDGKKLRQMADDLIIRFASDEEIFRHWVKPEYWREHLDYFRNKYQQGELDIDKFMSILVEDNRPKFFKKFFRSKAEKAIFKALEGKS